MEMYSLPAYEQILSRYLLGFNIGSAAFGILLYVFLSIGMYSIAKHRGIHKAWFAWFPVLRMWLLGCISDQYREVAKGQITKKRCGLLTLSIISAVCGLAVMVLAVVFVTYAVAYGLGLTHYLPLWTLILFLVLSLVGAVVGLAEMIVSLICRFDLFLSCTPNKAVLLFVLSIVFSWLYPFFVFAVRNRAEGMPSRGYYEGNTEYIQ